MCAEIEQHTIGRSGAIYAGEQSTTPTLDTFNIAMMTIRAVVAKFMSLTTTDHLEQSKRVQRRNADVPKTPLSDVWEGCSCRGERAIGASSVHGW